MSLGEWEDDVDHNDDVVVDEETGEILEAPDELEEPSLYYATLDEFVREQIVPVFRRRVGDRSQFRWAGDWWRHPEAVIRLEALWRSWEHLRLDPAVGISVWLRDHADYHLSVLMSDYGPFAKSQDTNEHGDPLPYTAPPPGLFPLT